MRKKLCLAVMFTLLCFTSILSAAIITNIKTTVGWTNTISFQVSEPVNLLSSGIVFTVSKGNQISSVWGLDGKLSLTASGNSSYTIHSTKWYPEGEGLQLLPKNQYSFSFSTSGENSSITAVSLEGNPDDGIVNFAQDSASQEIPANTTISLKSLSPNGNSYTINWNSTKSITLPYDTYNITAQAEVNNVVVPISVNTPNVTLNSDMAQANILLSYMPVNESVVAFTISGNLPSGLNSVTVTAKDTDSNTSENINVSPDQVATLFVVSGDNYTFTTSGVPSGYTGVCSPSSLFINATEDHYSVSISLNKVDSKKYPLEVNISGLPTNSSTSLSFTASGSLSPTVFNNIKNRNTTLYMLSGNYSITSSSVTQGSSTYISNPIDFYVSSSSQNSINLNFYINTGTATVAGWPNYIANGAVTDGDYTNTATFYNRPINAIFKYDGDGGNGDPGRIVYPIYTYNTEKQAALLTSQFAKQSYSNVGNVVPVMVTYTSEMSGGTAFKDFEDSNNYLTMHFINLILSSSVMQGFYNSNKEPGSMILNPDLLGMVEQQNLWKSDGSGILNTMDIQVQKAMSKAIWFCNTTHNWTIELSYGDPVVVNNITPIDLITKINDGGLKSQGVWSPWDTKNGFESEAINILNTAPSNYTNSIIPKFSNDFKGWIQANNWIMHTFAPNITFGWQSNVWSTGSSNWVHNDLTQDQIKNVYAGEVSGLWNSLGVYSGEYKPDFIVFDKYEMDSNAAAGIGYFWNQRDLYNYLSYVKNISKDLGNIPVMLWQIPGSHLQTNSTYAETSTEPDFFFGDTSINATLSNVFGLNQILMPSDAYNGYSGKTASGGYLTQGNQNWNTSHMNIAKDSNIFSILWGGGSTTSVGSYPAKKESYWLSQKIINYLNNPTFLNQ